MKEVTLYNHIRIGTAEKPIIPNLEFKILCEKIKEGDVNAYQAAKEKYSLIPFQHQLIQTFINEKNLPPIL